MPRYFLIGSPQLARLELLAQRLLDKGEVRAATTIRKVVKIVRTMETEVHGRRGRK